MRLRPVWILSALLLLFVGGVTTWVALTIPNDIRAEAILRQARNDLREGKRDESKAKLREIVRRYPRTDAAATAVDTLFQLSEQDRLETQRALSAANRERAKLVARLTIVEQRLAAATAPKPPVVVPAKPANKPVMRKAVKPAQRTTTRRRRR